VDEDEEELRSQYSLKLQNGVYNVNGQAINGYNNAVGSAAAHENKEEGKYRENYLPSI
jgi:hypothetical protein